MHQFDFPSKFYQIVCLIPIENNMHCCWIEIEERLKYKLYNIEDLSKITFWYHSNDTKVMLCSHWAINYLSGLPVMLQAFWHTAEGNWESKSSYIKSWWITKLFNSNLSYHRSKGFQEWGQSNKNLFFPH